jgi:hypothetical protein
MMRAKRLHRDQTSGGGAAGRMKMILEGAWVLVASIVVLLSIWAVVLVGSQFFGPR